MATDDAVDTALRTAANPGGLSGELSAVPQTAASITVNSGNVLQAAKIINDVLNSEGRNIQQNLARLSIAPPAQDVVSVQAAQQWNAMLVTDPYSASLAANSTRSEFVDLDDPRSKPAGWDASRPPSTVAGSCRRDAAAQSMKGRCIQRLSGWARPAGSLRTPSSSPM